jgi:hypothetical protein
MEKFERLTVDGLEVTVRVRDGWVAQCSDWIAIHDSAKFETKWALEGIWRQGEFYLAPQVEDIYTTVEVF